MEWDQDQAVMWPDRYWLLWHIVEKDHLEIIGWFHRQSSECSKDVSAKLIVLGIITLLHRGALGTDCTGLDVSSVLEQLFWFLESLHFQEYITQPMSGFSVNELFGQMNTKVYMNLIVLALYHLIQEQQGR